ncbi:unnamed protein product [Symbiodinium microadriaticum]|nr:unnamed protein product [Symbiodinium microadriaticum]
MSSDPTTLPVWQAGSPGKLAVRPYYEQPRAAKLVNFAHLAKARLLAASAAAEMGPFRQSSGDLAWRVPAAYVPVARLPTPRIAGVASTGIKEVAPMQLEVESSTADPGTPEPPWTPLSNSSPWKEMPLPARHASVPEPPLAPEAAWETSGSSGEAIDAESASEAVPSRWPQHDDRPLPDDEGAAPTQRRTRARWQSKTAAIKLRKVEKAFKQLKSEVTRLRRKVRKRSLSDEGLLLPSEVPAAPSEEAAPSEAPLRPARLPAPSLPAAPEPSERVAGSEAPIQKKKELEEGSFSPRSSETSEQPAPLEDVRTPGSSAGPPSEYWESDEGPPTPAYQKPRRPRRVSQAGLGVTSTPAALDHGSESAGQSSSCSPILKDGSELLTAATEPMPQVSEREATEVESAMARGEESAPAVAGNEKGRTQAPQMGYWVQVDAIRGLPRTGNGGYQVKAYWSAHPDQAVAFDTCPASSADQASTEDCIIRDQVLLPARAAPGLAVVEVLREGASSPDFRTELNVLDVQNHRLLDHPLAAESGSAKPSIHLRIWPHPLRRASQLGGPGDAKEGVAAVAASLQSGPSQSSLTEEDMEDEEFEEEEEEEEELEDDPVLDEAPAASGT